jgi:hypothetical protein
MYKFYKVFDMLFLNQFTFSLLRSQQFCHMKKQVKNYEQSVQQRYDMLQHQPCSSSCQWGETMSLKYSLLFIPPVMYKDGKPWRNDTDRENTITLRKTSSGATLSATNSTRSDLDLHSERLATNCLSHCTAL